MIRIFHLTSSLFLLAFLGACSNKEQELPGVYVHGKEKIIITKAGDKGFFITFEEKGYFDSEKQTVYCVLSDGCFIYSDEKHEKPIVCEGNNSSQLIRHDNVVFRKVKS